MEGISLSNLIVKVNGMSCNHCVETIKHHLLNLNGIKTVDINLKYKKVSIDYDTHDVNEQVIIEAIEQLGFEVLL